MSAEVEAAIEPATKKPFPKKSELGEVVEFIPMTKTCARELTDRIKTAADDLAELLWRAHEGKAWMALRYGSWREYCEAEFQMSSRHAYRLLAFVEVKNLLAECDPGVTPTSEKQVRPLTKLEPEQQSAAWARAQEIAGGDKPETKHVEQAAEEVSQPEKSPEDRIRDSVTRHMREEVNESISVALTLEWERMKNRFDHVEWEHFVSGVRSWLKRQ